MLKITSFKTDNNLYAAWPLSFKQASFRVIKLEEVPGWIVLDFSRFLKVSVKTILEQTDPKYCYKLRVTFPGKDGFLRNNKVWVIEDPSYQEWLKEQAEPELSNWLEEITPLLITAGFYSKLKSSQVDLNFNSDANWLIEKQALLEDIRQKELILEDYQQRLEQCSDYEQIKEKFQQQKNGLKEWSAKDEKRRLIHQRMFEENQWLKQQVGSLTILALRLTESQNLTDVSWPAIDQTNPNGKSENGNGHQFSWLK